MAKAMDILDIIKILLNGGRIAEKQPAVSGKSQYNVQIRTKAPYPAPYKTVGHMTEKMVNAMHKKGILEYTGEETRDKYGNYIFWYYLARKKQNEA